jgi:hypothetical protein
VNRAYDKREYDRVLSLVRSGVNDTQIAGLTGFSRATVRRWRLGSIPAHVARQRAMASWSVRNAKSYCYLLGVYLGDGTVWHRDKKGTVLQVVNDCRYPEISAEIRAAMRSTFPESAPRAHSSSAGESDVICISHPAVVRAFPQHGPGRKHLRPIVLVDWQRELTHQHPGALIRGLIHSDGCRAENRFKTTLPRGRVAEYHYVRYFFSNLSSDIRRIFVEHCELLGIRVTQSNHRNLSVSHRDSVAILEELVGPKL